MKACKTHEQYLSDLKRVHGNRIRVLGIYTAQSAPLDHECRVCSYVWNPNKGNLLQGHGCPKCAVAIRALGAAGPRKLSRSPEQYLYDLKSAHGEAIIALEPYRGTNKHIDHKCTICNHIWKATPDSRLQGAGCPKCFHVRRSVAISRTPEQYKLQLKTQHGDSIRVLAAYTKASVHTEHQCTICNHIWRATPDSILQGTGCPICARIYVAANNTLTQVQYLLKLSEIYGEGIKVLGAYTKYRESITHQCAVCTYIWRVPPAIVLLGKGCPCCSASTTHKSYKLGRKVVAVQGYEPQALDWLQRWYKPKDIIVQSSGNIPKIEYTFGGKVRQHRPDIYIPRKNRLIEVKGTYTAGLSYQPYYCTTPQTAFLMLRAKAKAAIAEGYDYRVVVIEDNKPLSLPKGWLGMNRSDVLGYLGY